MGYNTTVVILNDALGQIAKDPKFGEKLARAIMEVRRDKPVDVSAGNHCNAALVVETHHADETVFVAVGRNYGEALRLDYKGNIESDRYKGKIDHRR